MAELGEVLLLGGSGFVGRGLVARLGVDRVTVSYLRPQADASGRATPRSFRFDAAMDDLPDVVPDLGRFSHGVVLLGDTRLNSCFSDQRRSRAINVDGVCRALDRLVEHGVFPVFTSTEAVFDGSRGNYTETDEPRPLHVYGQQKLEVERHLLAIGADHLLLRLAMVYGDEPGNPSLLGEWAAKIRAGTGFTCAHDNRCSPIHVDDCAAATVRLMERGCRGVFHVAGTRAVSRCDIADLLTAAAELGGHVPPEVRRCGIDDFGLPEPRPHDVSLDASRCIAATDLVPREVAVACRTLIDRTFAAR